MKNFKYFIYGILVLTFTAILFGFPDTLFGTGNIYKYFYHFLSLDVPECYIYFRNPIAFCSAS